MEEKIKRKNLKKKGGRPLQIESEKVKKSIIIRFYNDEYDRLKKDFSKTGLKYFHDYIKKRISDTENLYIHNPVEIIKSLDKIGNEIAKIGTNINQIAKHANTLELSTKNNKSIIYDINEFKNLLIIYTKQRSELNETIQKLLSKK